MNRLNAHDAHAVLDFVTETATEEPNDGAPFSPPVLDALRTLVPCDEVAYCELDRDARATLRVDVSPLAGAGLDEALFWSIVGEHPICLHQQRTRDPGPVTLHDLVGIRELRNSRIYADWFRPLAIEDELEVTVGGSQRHTKNLLFDRAAGRFGERDRAVAAFLRPHLAAMETRAVTRRAAQGLAAIAEAIDRSGCGAVAVGAGGEVAFATALARRQLAEHFGDRAPALLPPPLRDWLTSGRDGAFVHEAGGRRLTARRADRDVVLLELGDAAERPLTAREREILELVGRGQSNAQIARGLWISPGTVRKHLENAYAKLGVGNRTAAAARVAALRPPRG